MSNGTPGDDPNGYTLDGARALSRNCHFCHGEGLATIFNPRYTGSAVGYVFDRQGNRKPVCMRTTAYCLCAAGRKIMILHQANKDSRPMMHDIHDVIAGKYHSWVVDDPTYDPNIVIDIEALPAEVRRFANAIKEPRIFDPGAEHDRINRMFDDSEEAV